MTIRTRLLTLLLCASVCQSMFPQSAAVWSNGAVDAIQQVDSTAIFRLEGKPYLQIWSSGRMVYSDHADSLQFLPVGEDYRGYVDLGLSVKWATCNVGATAPEDYGDYFAWGETSPKSDYSWSTYKYSKGSDYDMTKYCNNIRYGNNGYTDNKTVLDLEDDAAHVNWGGDWRMPTSAELEELSDTDNCTWTWTTLNGVNGYKVESKKSGYEGNWIFLPATGLLYGTVLDYVDSLGGFWSSSLSTDSPDCAYQLYFDSSSIDWGDGDRLFGLPVRPVCPLPIEVTSISLDITSLELTEGDRITLTATVTPDNATNKNITWSSSNTAIAKVNESGMVTAVNAGSAIITVTTENGGKTATCSVTVNEKSNVENPEEGENWDW